MVDQSMRVCVGPPFSHVIVGDRFSPKLGYGATPICRGLLGMGVTPLPVLEMIAKALPRRSLPRLR